MRTRGPRSRKRGRTLGMCVAALGLLALSVSTMPQPAQADDDPDRTWASIDVATGFVDNILGCTWAVCGDPESAFRQNYASRGFMLLDLDTIGSGQRPGPGWWYVDGAFIRDSFERNVRADARILGVELRWSTGGLGTDTGDVTFTVEVAPTGQRFTTSSSTLLIDPLEAGVEHTFTVTATRSDGSTVQGPVVSATPQADPDPDCTDRSVARECRAATDWAVVDPSTMIVANVIVCTPWQCGADGEWGARMPADTPWPGFLLIELAGRGGIGWQYVDGTFVDVRPSEEPEEPESPPSTSEDGEATDSVGSDDGPDRAPETEAAPEADDAVADAVDDASQEPDDAADREPGSTPDTDADDVEEVAATDADGGPADTLDTQVGSGTTSTDGADAGTTPTTDEPVEALATDVEEEPAPGPIRRAITGFVAFLRGLFGN